MFSGPSLVRAVSSSSQALYAQLWICNGMDAVNDWKLLKSQDADNIVYIPM